MTDRPLPGPTPSPEPCNGNCDDPLCDNRARSGRPDQRPAEPWKVALAEACAREFSVGEPRHASVATMLALIDKHAPATPDRSERLARWIGNAYSGAVVAERIVTAGLAAERRKDLRDALRDVVSQLEEARKALEVKP